MYATSYDPSRLFLVQLHTGGVPTSAEIENVVRSIDVLRRDAEAMGGAPVTILVIVETEASPTPAQRRRLADALRTLGRGWVALVAPSVMTRAIVTGIRWLRGDTRLVETIHASYEPARRWLTERTGHPEPAIDAIVRELRARAS